MTFLDPDPDTPEVPVPTPTPKPGTGKTRPQDVSDAMRLTDTSWKDIPGWEDRYAICRSGWIKSKARYTEPQSGRLPVWLEESIVHPCRLRSYWVAGLNRNGKRHVVYIHKLLQQLFMGPCPEGHKLKINPLFKVEHLANYLSYTKLLGKRLPLERAEARAQAKRDSRKRVAERKAEAQATINRQNEEIARLRRQVIALHETYKLPAAEIPPEGDDHA